MFEHGIEYISLSVSFKICFECYFSTELLNSLHASADFF